MKTTILTMICLTLASALPAEDLKAKTDNPLYRAWPMVVGTKMHFARATRISGGLPGLDEVSREKIIYQLTKITPAGLTISVGGKSFTVPAEVVPDAPGSPKLIGTKNVKIGDKTYPCTVYHYTTSSSAEIGFDTYGMGADVTVWVTPNVAGGVVRRRIALVVKASYLIDDTWTFPTIGKKSALQRR